MGEKGDVDQFFLGIPNVNWPTEYRTRTITKKSYGLRAASPLRVAGKRASERRSGEGRRKRRALTLFPRTLVNSLSFRLVRWPLARDFSRRACSLAVTVFIFVRDGSLSS